MLRVIRTGVHALLFSGVYTAIVAVGASLFTARFFALPVNEALLLFTFGGTLLSYNLHWWLSPVAFFSATGRAWSLRHHRMRPALMVAGLLLSGYGLLQLSVATIGVSMLATAATLLYSAPKIPLLQSRRFKTVTAAKTFYLAAVWLLVTVLLPVVEANGFSIDAALFAGHRFFFIYALCLLFDLRDLQADSASGLRTLATRFPLYLQAYIFSLLLLASTVLAVLCDSRNLFLFTAMIVPVLVLSFLYSRARSSHSDVFYYLVLDGLIALPVLFFLLKAAFL